MIGVYLPMGAVIAFTSKRPLFESLFVHSRGCNVPVLERLKLMRNATYKYTLSNNMVFALFPDKSSFVKQLSVFI